MRDELVTVNSRLASIESKVQNLTMKQSIQLDDGLLAVLNLMGWVVIPQEEAWLLFHFASGISTHEPGTIAVLEKILRTGDTVIDVGAHIGLISLPIARLIGSSGRLIALEPYPRAAECLRLTLSSNGLDDRSKVLEVAASDEDTLIDYFFGVNSMMGSLIQAPYDQGSVTVGSAKLDSIVALGSRVDFVKIDVEGLETKVVDGMRRIISDNPDIFVMAEFGTAHLERFGINVYDWFDVFFQNKLTYFEWIDEANMCHNPISIENLALLDRIKHKSSVNILFCRPTNSRIDALPAAINSSRS